MAHSSSHSQVPVGLRLEAESCLHVLVLRIRSLDRLRIKHKKQGLNVLYSTNQAGVGLWRFNHGMPTLLTDLSFYPHHKWHKMGLGV